MTASFNGHVEIVRLLVAAKTQLNIQGKEVLRQIKLQKRVSSY